MYCDLELKPPKISKNSKKIYCGLFLREKQRFTYIYNLDGLYICSIHQSKDAKEWIDKNQQEIQKRIDELPKLQTNSPTLFG